MNSTAVRVTWTPLNETVADYYTVQYSRVNVSDIVGFAIFPASTSSGVVSGLQDGQWYQFRVSVSLIVNGQIFNSTPGDPRTAITGIRLSMCSYISSVFTVLFFGL